MTDTPTIALLDAYGDNRLAVREHLEAMGLTEEEAAQAVHRHGGRELHSALCHHYQEARRIYERAWEEGAA